MTKPISDEQIEETPQDHLPRIAARAFAEFMQRGESTGPIATAFLRQMLAACPDDMGENEELEAALEDFPH